MAKFGQRQQQRTLLVAAIFDFFLLTTDFCVSARHTTARLISTTENKSSSDSQPPNILVLFADDLGYGDLSCYGHPTTETPNLDKLAGDGMRFTAWYSGFHVCSPSRGSLLTGRIPPRIGLAGASWIGGVFKADAVGGLPHNETTIAEALRGAGYATKAIGKWHLGQQPQYLPTAHGFDSYYGIPYSVDMGDSAWTNAPDKKPYLPLVQSKQEGHVEVLEQPTDLNMLSSRYINESRKFITDYTEAGTPWFLYMAFNHMHVPDFCTMDYCNTTRRGVYGDALAELDDAVGDIVNAVDDAGASEDTIIFFSSDNGPWLKYREAGGSGGPLRDGKTTTWEGGIRVPGIVRWKGKVEPGQVERQPVATYDIFPTALAVAGVNWGGEGGAKNSDVIIDGVDLSPVLFRARGEMQEVASTGQRRRGQRRGKDLHECLFHYKGTPGMGCPREHPNCPGLWAVRCGSYKMHYVTTNWQNENVQTFHDPPLIFHIDHDPGESFPLNPNDPVYKRARSIIDAKVQAHKKTMPSSVPNQIAKGANPDLQVCCNGSKSYDECNCNPENMKVFVCDGGNQLDDGGPYPVPEAVD